MTMKIKKVQRLCGLIQILDPEKILNKPNKDFVSSNDYVKFHTDLDQYSLKFNVNNICSILFMIVIQVLSFIIFKKEKLFT
jgi:hypothetical protein